MKVEKGELKFEILLDRDALRSTKFPRTVDIEEIPLSGE